MFYWLTPRFASDAEYVLKDKPYSHLKAVFLSNVRLFRLRWLWVYAKLKSYTRP